jgi:hypothetical protein
MADESSGEIAVRLTAANTRPMMPASMKTPVNFSNRKDSSLHNNRQNKVTAIAAAS